MYYVYPLVDYKPPKYVMIWWPFTLYIYMHIWRPLNSNMHRKSNLRFNRNHCYRAHPHREAIQLAVCTNYFHVHRTSIVRNIKRWYIVSGICASKTVYNERARIRGHHVRPPRLRPLPPYMPNVYMLIIYMNKCSHNRISRTYISSVRSPRISLFQFHGDNILGAEPNNGNDNIISHLCRASYIAHIFNTHTHTHLYISIYICWNFIIHR